MLWNALPKEASSVKVGLTETVLVETVYCPKLSENILSSFLPRLFKLFLGVIFFIHTLCTFPSLEYVRFAFRITLPLKVPVTLLTIAFSVVLAVQSPVRRMNQDDVMLSAKTPKQNHRWVQLRYRGRCLDLKCPECGYPMAKFVERKFEDVKKTREHRTEAGGSYTTAITKKRAVYKRDYFPKCRHTWEEGERQ